MSNSNHEESLTGLPPPGPGGGGDSIVTPVVVVAPPPATAGIGATPVSESAAALETRLGIMLDTVGWGWLVVLTASVAVSTGLESAAAA
jgi:hypothetical protein